MKVLLRDDVEKLGNLGDVVEVASGYARNYLLPRQLAVQATRENEALIEQIKRRRRDIEKARRQTYVEKAEAMRGQSITIVAKVADERNLFGSVDAAQIAETVSRDLSFEIDAKQVLIERPFKELGTYDVQLRLYPKVTTEIKLWVVEE